MISAIKQQAKELSAELNRVDWPTKDKVMSSAWTVVVISLFVGAFLWSVDWVLSKGFAGFFLKTR